MSVDTANPDTSAAAKRDRAAPVGRWAVRALAAVGALSLIGVTAGAVVDFLSFDRTSGGYEAPYTGWTGTPIDWTEGGVTETGFRKPGIVLDVALDCTTGMVTVHSFGLAADWRVVSERAIAVHRPREACTDAGFTPQF